MSSISQHTTVHAPHRVSGTVVAVNRGTYEVETPEGTITCALRGKLRKEFIHPERQGGRRAVLQARQRPKDPVAAGDQVVVLVHDQGQGVIEQIATRAHDFSRVDVFAPTQLQTLVAGIDQIIAVFAAREPEPHLGMLDRFLVLAEAAEVACAVCINKIDLGLSVELEHRLTVYRALGYPVVVTSAADGIGLDELRSLLSGKASALVGPSGVGKSSLILSIEPHYDLQVKAVSTSTHKGQHTTTGTRLFALSGPEGGYLADTAGLRALGTQSVPPDDLPDCFPDFRPYLERCRMPSCTHLREPGCAVRMALAKGKIDEGRYQSYRRMRAKSNQ